MGNNEQWQRMGDGHEVALKGGNSNDASKEERWREADEYRDEDQRRHAGEKSVIVIGSGCGLKLRLYRHGSTLSTIQFTQWPLYQELLAEAMIRRVEPKRSTHLA